MHRYAKLIRIKKCGNALKQVVSTLFTQRRRRDLNSRAAINDLLPFQGSPFSHLGTSPKASLCGYKLRGYTFRRIPNGEGGIRTHVPLRTNGFQDRLVMTTSIPLHVFSLSATRYIISCVSNLVNNFFYYFYLVTHQRRKLVYHSHLHMSTTFFIFLFYFVTIHS